MPAGPNIVMYTQMLCGYCSAARRLLESKGAEFTEIDVTMNSAKRQEMTDRSGRRTVPQIFFDDRHIGGYDDLAALEQSGDLDGLLGRSDNS
ncbi:MAG: glutaredoxin 3 [Gammaproteobacteria bacterium]|nr:glutaredoxin 3 [Gammaproteobacteria bacterium]